MSRYRHILFILVLLLSGSTIMPAGLSEWLSSAGAPGIPDVESLAYDFYLPLVVSPAVIYTVTGSVEDESGNPMEGVLITSSSGQTTTSNASGDYAIDLPEGNHALSPSLNGYVFTPAVTELQLSGDLNGQDFVAVQAGYEAFTNGSFESNIWWTFPDSGWPAVYSTDIVHNGGRAVRAGILDPANNRYVYSSLRSQAITIPENTASARLRLWLYPISGETSQATLPDITDSPAFGNSTTAYDAQYVMVLDSNNGLLETLLWIRSDNQMWTYHEFNLDKWAGQTIKVQVGAYNDGTDGVTGMYVDDASLLISQGGTIPQPTPSACANYLYNSGFEYNGAWDIPTTPYPAGYSADYAYAGVRSMRTGIPLWAAVDRYSYSDAWQTVSIPSNATSAVLRMKLLPRSQETALASDEAPPVAPPEPGAVWGEAPLSGDAQYVLILNPSNYTIRETLLWWNNKHLASWRSKEFDLTKYRGQTIRIQFGTYNNGNGLRSVMYVDEIYLDVCTTPITPTPTVPPSECTELLKNRSFEKNRAWVIPPTEFSAGYSTFLKHTGARSMRSGIYYQAHNRYSYSDFRQTVYIPYGISKAKLKFWTFAISGEASASDAPPLPERPTAGINGADSMSGDVQYLLILDYYGNWIDTLLWRRSNEQYWRNWSYNLRPYAGTTIQLQFGTYNNGWGGVTSMYVDDASLLVCP